MQPPNKPTSQPPPRNVPSNLSDHMESLLFAMDSETSTDNTVWVPDNYDIQLSSHELDDIMNEADHTHPNYQRQPAHSAPMSAPSHLRQFHLRSAPSQASHSNVRVKEELQQLATASRPHPHRSHPHQHLSPHTPQSQSLPPQPPTSHVSPAQSHHQRIIMHQHLHHSTPPHAILPHDLAVSQHMSAVELNQAFSLPQTIAGSFPTKQEPSLLPSAPQYLVSPEQGVTPHVPPYHSPQQVLPLHNDPRVVDRDMYVRRSAQKAEEAKLAHRKQLKQEQRHKEADAEARGSPLTAKDKERERSRRESAVTRKRAEIYILELEHACRRLPEVEQRLRFAEAELHRTKRWISDFERQSRQAQQMNTMLAVSRQQEVKTEPGLSLSPNSEQTTTVLNRMQQLDLRLPNTSEAGP